MGYLVAAYRALSHSLDDVAALVIVGSGYFVASLIALLVAQLTWR